MKLHQMVKGIIGVVNPQITGSLYRSKGSVTRGAFHEPSYEDPVAIELQIQSVSNKILQQIDNINQQGEMKIVYAHDQLYGIDRVRGVGGDLLEFYGRRWKVIQRLEGWEKSGWCKVLVVAQMDKPQDDEEEIRDYVGDCES